MEQQEVFFVRHPEIDRGLVPTCYGQLNLPLTPLGHRMIAVLVREAKEWAPQAVLTSDLDRCLLPAKAITAELDLKPEVDPVWREISMGQWEGRSWAELKSEHPETLSNWMRDYVKIAAPGGESYEQLAARVFAALKNLEKRPERRLWVMTHGGVIRALVSRLLEVPLEKSWAIETAYAAGVLLRRTGDTWKLIFDSPRAIQAMNSEV